MIRCYFDTETTGLPLHDKLLSHPGQPHLVELAAQVWDDSRGHKLAEINTLIQPDGWTIPPEATAIHGITSEDCERDGLPLFKVLSLFSLIVLCAEEIVVQNEVFEWSIIRTHAGRAGAIQLLGFMQTRRWRDTTKMGGLAFPDLPLSSHGLGPRQSAIYERLHGCQPEGKHRAMGDVRTLRVNFLALDSILSHQAAEKPEAARPGSGSDVGPSYFSAATTSGSNSTAIAGPAAPGQAVTAASLAGAEAESPAPLSEITRSVVQP